MKENNEQGKLTSGTHPSCWTATPVDMPKLPSLKEDLSVDVVIVGGGLAGLSVAYCLSRAGKKIALVEDGLLASGETGRTTAHLVTVLDDRYYKLEKNFGEEKTRQIALSHASAIDFVERTIKLENIDCDFERLDGYLMRHPSDDHASLNKELGAALRAGINVHESPEIIAGLGPCLRFPGQAQFHPLKYIRGLSEAILRRGGKIFIETHASHIDHRGIRTANGQWIQADHVVVATNSPVNNKFAIHLKQYAYRTYVIGARVKKNSIPEALFWDTGDMQVNPDIPPYHYVRTCPLDNEYDLLISGGEDHPTADTGNITEKERYRQLEKWTREHFKIEEILYRWSGQVLEPMDGLAYIGRNPLDKENVFIVTGDSGNGMTHCTIAGMLITDLITGRDNPWEELYKPSRFTFRASKPFFKEVIGALLAAFQKDPSHKDHASLASVEKGEAKEIDLHGEPCGVYRDEEGQLHVVSTKCTHLGCGVKWNNDEKSWDCPCHGSRFTYDGKVINGPANTDLPACSEVEIMKEY